MITTPLVSVEDVRSIAKLEWTIPLLQEIQAILYQVDWLLWSYIWNRYIVDNFTEDNLVWTDQKTLELLKSITLQASVWRLLMSSYWIQMLKEDMNANYLYQTQVDIMEQIWKWTIRLLDINNKEFALVPLPNRSIDSVKSSFGCRGRRSFTEWQQR